MKMELSTKKLKNRIKTARIELGYRSRNKRFCDDKDFNILLRKMKYFNKKSLTARHLKYIEDGYKKKGLDKYILAFCYRFRLSLKQFYNTNEEEFHRHIKNRKNLNDKKNNSILTLGDNYYEKLISINDKLQNKLYDHKSYETFNIFLENTYLFTTTIDERKYLDSAYLYYKFAIETGFHPELVLNYILDSLRDVANRCYLNKPLCPDTMKKTTEENDERIFINRTFCENIIRLVSRYNSQILFNNIDFSALDLRRLYLINYPGGHETNNLKGASFRGSNLAYAMISGIDLTDTNFDDIVCAKNTYLVGEDTFLIGASFKNANLIGVNRHYDDNGKGERFVPVKNMRYILETSNNDELEEIYAGPFFDATSSDVTSFDKALLDPWLENQLFEEE